jgi:hypothetical protein
MVKRQRGRQSNTKICVSGRDGIWDMSDRYLLLSTALPADDRG